MVKITKEQLQEVLAKTDSKHVGQYIGLLGMAVANGSITLLEASAFFEELKVRFC